VSANFLKVRNGITLKPTDQPPGENGDIYYDSTDNRFWFYQNGAWVTFGINSANQQLSNLNNVAINDDLIFGTGVSGTLKTKNGTTSTSLSIKTGDASAGNSGDISIVTGSASGTRGKILLKDGSEGTAGWVWKSIDASGAGNWSPDIGFNVNDILTNNNGEIMVNEFGNVLIA
jgi:hypothetical protein